MTEPASMVSCIMPTYNRRAFVPLAIRYFLRQDYQEKELIILDDGTDPVGDLIPDSANIRYYRFERKMTLGAKLNLACSFAEGTIIAHWDDDDWYAPRRLSYQVKALQDNSIDLCGINHLYYFNLDNKQGFFYEYPADRKIWLSGSTLCYTRNLWMKNPFADINVGMDGLFSWATPPDRIKVLEDPSFSVHMIHDQNVSPKKTGTGYWTEFPAAKIAGILKDDWDYYKNGFFNHQLKAVPAGATMPEVPFHPPKKLKNIYACLVHEKPECIVDLVRNLHYHDPDSVILLYNGSANPDLLKGKYPFEKYHAVVHPSPVPQKHGYLHKFALDCMEFALANFKFDIFTNVDSDQLSVRKDYSGYMSEYFATKNHTGMLSSNPERVLPEHKSNHTALQAYKEYDLWKPLLKSFPGGEDSFVHWTFWPSTVFSADACKDLLDLFEKNELVKQIMNKTKIWATEEVIFPTLVKLLGYDIAANPCNYDFVKYRKIFSPKEVNTAFTRKDVFWVHPVERTYENTLRTSIRAHFNEYNPAENSVRPIKKNENLLILNSALINDVRKIQGWLSDAEADLLAETIKTLCRENPGIHYLVETGSYHGKSTVLTGRVLQALQPSWKIFSIDPHDGKLGAADLGLKTFPPSFEIMKRNIANAGLGEMVRIIRSKTPDVTWKDPVLFLFIDGLHDYPHVAQDFFHFSGWLEKDGYVAFHDYADYFPGVKAFVDELIAEGSFVKIQQAESLVILKRS